MPIPCYFLHCTHADWLATGGKKMIAELKRCLILLSLQAIYPVPAQWPITFPSEPPLILESTATDCVMLLRNPKRIWPKEMSSTRDTKKP